MGCPPLAIARGRQRRPRDPQGATRAKPNAILPLATYRRALSGRWAQRTTPWRRCLLWPWVRPSSCSCCSSSCLLWLCDGLWSWELGWGCMSSRLSLYFFCERRARRAVARLKTVAARVFGPSMHRARWGQRDAARIGEPPGCVSQTTVVVCRQAPTHNSKRGASRLVVHQAAVG